MLAPAIPIFVKRFWTTYQPIILKDEAGKVLPIPEGQPTMREVDWVEYGQVGAIDRTAVIDKVARLAKVRPIDEAPDNMAIVFANMRWDAIRPLYENWKAGRAMVLDGTPLAAWNRLSPEQADSLRILGVMTVEGLVGLTEATMQRLGIPGIRELMDEGRRFLAASTTNRVEEELRQRDAKIETQGAELDDLRAQLAELSALVKADLAAGADAAPAQRGRQKVAEAA